MNDLVRMQQLLAKHPNAVIMTTEKDAVKLFNSAAIPTEVRRRMFFEHISLDMLYGGKNTLIEKIDKDIKNLKNETHIKGF